MTHKKRQKLQQTESEYYLTARCLLKLIECHCKHLDTVICLHIGKDCEPQGGPVICKKAEFITEGLAGIEDNEWDTEDILCLYVEETTPSLKGIRRTKSAAK